MKPIRYPNGMILKGVHSRVSLLRQTKRNVTGSIAAVTAPKPSASIVPPVTPFVHTWSPTLGLTGFVGACGRNYLHGKFKVTATGAPTIIVAVKTLAGTKTIKTAIPSTTTGTVAPIPAPGTLVLKGIATATIKGLKYWSLKVDGTTPQMM